MKFSRWFEKLTALSLSYRGRSKCFVFILIFTVLISVVAGSGLMFAQSSVEVGLSLTVEPLLDKYGIPAINDDGTFYNNDRFEVAYHTELADGAFFEEIQVNYDLSVFNMFNHSDFGLPVGVCSFSVLPSAIAGTYQIHFNTQNSRSVDNNTQNYTVEASVEVMVVEYDPHFSLELSYTTPNAGNGSSFDKPFALIIRYEGNGPDYNLNQRAVLDNYSWTGYAQKLPELDTAQITSNVTIANFFSKNANVQFTIQGIENRINQPILTVDNVHYLCDELPLTFFFEANTNHTYTWAQNLTVASDSEGRVLEWFEWQFCNIFPPPTNGLDLSQINPDATQEKLQSQLMDHFNSKNGTLTVTQLGNTATAIYAHNKLLKLFAKETGVNQEQTLQCLTTTPLYFTSENRYTKLQYTLNPKITKEITNQNFTSALYYSLSVGCDWFGQPKYFEANFTVDYEFYDKQFNATAYKWDQTLQTWSINNTVNIRTVFESAFNFTETDVLRSNFEEQTTDQTALNMDLEDLYDSGAQTFVGQAP